MTPLLSSALLRGQTDERLVELAAAGHDRAFEAIVERYRRPLQRYLRRLLSDTLAEDVVQATFINAWSSLRTGTEVRDLRPWLYRIAHNAAINALKKVGEAMEEVPESAGGFATEPAAELERRDEMQRALTSIAALPSRQRAALLAVAVDGRAHSDVADELGLTDGAVRQLVHRARTTLRTGFTALTPLPLIHALVASAGDSTVGRVAEVAAGAGGAGAASVSLKAGAAAVLATGALVTGGPELAKVVHPSQKPSEPQTRAAAPAPTSTAARTPAAFTTPPATTAAARTPASSSAGASGSGTTHKQWRRGRDEDSSSSSRHSGRSGGESRRHRSDGDNSGSGSGHRRGSGHSGRGDGDADNAAQHGRRDGDDGSGSGRHSGGGSGGGDRDGGGGKGETSGRSGGDEQTTRTAPPATTTAPSGGGGGDSGGSGGGEHAETTPAPAQTAPPAPPATTSEPRTAPAPAPAPAPDGSGGDGDGGSGSG
jgi:RNA polymerase sigma factor (sigma-70 family)